MTQTGTDGGFSLSIAEGDILFLTKPAGYAPPVDRDSAPLFHCVHDPDGTPAELGLRFGGVAPTGPLPAAIDFPFDRVMSVRGTEVTMRYKAASLPPDHQMRITVAPVFEHPSLGPAAPQNTNEAPIPRARLEAMELVVNLFDGGPKSKVWFAIDGGPAVAMARSARVDALVAKLSLRIKDRSVYWTPPRDSTHIRAAPLPRGLAPGVRRIAIRAIDEYGQEHQASRLIEVAP